MKTLHFNQIRFLKSAAGYEGFPRDSGAEVAFAGRSNSGKSSALNAITGINRLARTSKIPGRTQLINFFEFDPDHRLVDLPGYGYAKVPEAVKLQWKTMLEEYLKERQSLKGLILLMDIRHPLMPFDWQMIEFATSFDLPLHVLLSKADKLKRAAQQETIKRIRKELSGYEDYLSIQVFSAHNGEGIEEVQHILKTWLLEG